MIINQFKLITLSFFVCFFINSYSYADNYICEVKNSGGIKYHKTSKNWKGTAFQVSEVTRQFSITKVTENDYKDDTFQLFDRMSYIPAKTLRPKYKIKTIYRSVSKVFKVCENDFNQNGYLLCANGDIIFNKNSMRFQKNVTGSYIQGENCDKEMCQDAIVSIGTCSKL